MGDMALRTLLEDTSKLAGLIPTSPDCHFSTSSH